VGIIQHSQQRSYTNRSISFISMSCLLIDGRPLFHSYAYKVIRYLTLTDNIRPFPLRDFPDEMEKVEETANFK